MLECLARLLLIAARAAALITFLLGLTAVSAEPVLEQPRYSATVMKTSTGYCQSFYFPRVFAESALGACVTFLDEEGIGSEVWSSISILSEGGRGNLGDDEFIEGPACLAEAPTSNPAKPMDRSIFALCPPRTIQLDRNLGEACSGLIITNSASINPATGNLYQTETDYEGAGPFPLVLRRTYNSLSGRGWQHSYANAIRYRADSPDLYVYRPDGKVLTFRAPLDPSGQPLLEGRMASDPDVGSVLDALSDPTGALTGFRYRTENDRIETYDVIGRLVTIRDPNGLLQTLSYDSLGRLSEVRDEFGRSLTFGYDSEDRLATVLTPDGPLSYGYDTSRRLSSVAYPDATPTDPDDNPKRHYHHEDPRFTGHLTGITDENGRRHATWSYDLAGRVALFEKPGEVDTLALTYNPDGTSTVLDALGTEKTYSFDLTSGVFRPLQILGGPCSGCAGQAQGYTYDSSGHIASKTDWNGTTTAYEHNDRGLEIRRAEAVGTPEERVFTTEWHPEFRRPVKITEPGRETAYTYDASGRALTRTVTDTLTSEARSWTYAYNAQGLLASIDGPRTDVGDVTTFEYDDGGNLIRSINALGHAVEIIAHDASGRPLTLVDPNGLVTELDYDFRGRLVSYRLGKGSESQTTVFDYDNVGNVVRITSPDGSFLDYTYDAAYRLTAIENDAGNRIEYSVDARGNRTAETIYDQNGALRRTRSMVYDNLSRLIQNVGAQTQVTAFGYDANGNAVSITDPLNRATVQSFDTLDRLTRVIDAANGQTDYAYDASDNLTAVTDPNGNTTNYTYNAFGEVVRQSSPDTGTTRFVYDAAGNLLSRTDAKGQTISYAYDALDRPTAISYPGGTIGYDYDAGPDGIGRLTNISHGSGHTAYQYDPLGRIETVTQFIAGQTYISTYTYDLNGNIRTVTYPSGRAVDYLRDGLGRVLRVSVSNRAATQTLASDIGYLPFGSLNRITYGNGLSLTRGFSQNYRLTGIMALGIGLDASIDYDAAGNLTAINDNLNPANSQSFAYDSLDRLTDTAGFLGAVSYNYDPNGNRTQWTRGIQSDTYFYAPDSNRLQQVTGLPSRTYDHDATGRLVQVRLPAGPLDLEYDAAGRLTQVSIGPVPLAAYRYNEQNQRVIKQVGTRTTVYLYDLAGRLIAEHDADGSLLRELVWLNDLPLAQIDPDGAVYYFHTDHLDTPRAATDSAGRIVWTWASTPFGLGEPNEDPDRDGRLVTVNLRFPGQYYDAETGLHYNWHRYYDPSTGRYITSDPIGLAGGLNTYQYAEANTLRYWDFYGLDSMASMVTGLTGIPYNQLPSTPEAAAAMNYLPDHANAPQQLGRGYLMAMGIIATGPTFSLTRTAAGGLCTTEWGVSARMLATDQRLLDFVISLFPGPPAQSYSGAAGAITGSLLTPIPPEELFR